MVEVAQVINLENPSIVASRRSVPNLHPITEPRDYRIALIGEAPGEEEEQYRRPFVGASGKFLTNILNENGIDRNQCFLGNVAQFRPRGNRFEEFAWDGPEVKDGLDCLISDLRSFNPNILVALGNVPLHASKFGHVPPLKGKSGLFDWPARISSWSGSLFFSPTFQCKVVPAFHPAGILRFWGKDGNFPRLKHSITRAKDESKSPNLILPERTLVVNLSADEIVYLLDTWPTRVRCSVDMEGGLSPDDVNEGVKADAKQRRHLGWRCVALSSRPNWAFAIMWWKFNDYEKGRILRSYGRLMERRDVPKVLQNSLYDAFVHGYSYGIHIRNVKEDVMLKGWEKYCELPKGLACQASVWTREPHWKDDDMYQSTGEGLAVGCCKDTAVTLEICQAQDSALSPPSLRHYQFNVDLLNPLLYMELRGIRYDIPSVQKKLEETKKEITEVAERICGIAGKELRGAKGSLSSKKLATSLYVDKGYPAQYKKEGGRKTNKFTTDVEALLTLYKKCKGDQFLTDILRHRHLEGIIETLNIKPDRDGRVRCGYNIVGTETGRPSCYTSPTGSGAALTTITKKLRHNYIADEGCELGQVDLAGADGWTVAARLFDQGYPTMFEDLSYGIKIAKVIVLLRQLGVEINKLDRESLKNICRAVDPDGWEYFACKRVQHGTNYMMKVPTLCTTIMKDSYKLIGEPLYLEQHEGAAFQQSYLSRYTPGIPQWHNWAEAIVVSKGELFNESVGHTRIFFGRRFGRDNHDTVKEFLAHEPQLVTSFATNRALHNLWHDRDNRRANGSLIVEPLHHVYDALLMQWPIADRLFAVRKIAQWFNNSITIGSCTFTIKWEGGSGRSWGECTTKI